MLRVTSYLPAGTPSEVPVDTVVLAHDQRHLRRKLLHLTRGDMVMLDLKEAVQLSNGDILQLDNGDCVEVVAATEKLFEIRARDQLHLMELAWHLGNRHLSVQIEEDRLLILRDHVIRAMLEGLGAAVADVDEPFHTVRGAYHGGHSHGHDHSHDHGKHGHDHHSHD